MTVGQTIVLCGVALLLPGIAGRAKADAGEAAISDQVPPEGRATLTVAGAGSYRPLTGRERWHLLLRDAFWGPGVFFRAAGPALGAHLDNQPPEWGQGAGGYGRRFANRMGRSALRGAYEAAGAAALGHEVRYIRARRSGFFPRAAHAIAANFVTYDRNGRRTAHVARLGSVFASEFTGNLWMPSGRRSASTAMRGAGVQLGVGSAFNLIREFAPGLKRKIAGK